MKQLELTPSSFKVLWYLKDKAITSITMISNACKITRPTAMMAFRDLQEKEFIKATKEGTIYHLENKEKELWI